MADFCVHISLFRTDRRNVFGFNSAYISARSVNIYRRNRIRAFTFEHSAIHIIHIHARNVNIGYAVKILSVKFNLYIVCFAYGKARYNLSVLFVLIHPAAVIHKQKFFCCAIGSHHSVRCCLGAACACVSNAVRLVHIVRRNKFETITLVLVRLFEFKSYRLCFVIDNIDPDSVTLADRCRRNIYPRQHTR